MDKVRSLSIVIPMWNEEGNITPLVKRIDKTIKTLKLPYEIILVDDISTDNSLIIAKKLAEIYPIKILEKKDIRHRGKAQSLLSGFAYAKNDGIVMIDADLQYPPEAIADMIKLLNTGADVIVANRYTAETTRIRKLFSMVFRTVFGKMLHKFDCDIQSGLKAFRREVIMRIRIDAKNWMFDLPFLIAARDAGFAIASFDVPFAQRASGKEKINIVKASFVMAWHAVRMYLASRPVIPFSKSDSEISGHGFHYRGHKYTHYSRLPIDHSAFFRINRKQQLVLLVIGVSLIIDLIVAWHTTLIAIVGILTIFYFTDLLFLVFLLSRSLFKPRIVHVTHRDIHDLSDADLPVYTVFCPLYREWKVIPQFIRAMSQLDYPKDKLQVLLLLEEDDRETVNQVSEMRLPPFVEIRIIPDGKPKTKPKALNYGLRFARGQYSVIYDAEDIPEPEQLKKAVLAFERVPKSTICLQAKLNFYNPKQNLITRIFTAEYSLWFDLILPGLETIQAPIPLGGTSNHFRTRDIIKLHGWDAFNVTEDCDLGMRIAKRGLKTAMINSDTMEEPNSKPLNWINQRSRWIKGYIQTYFVHTRSARSLSWKKHSDHLLFQITIGGKVLSMFINPLMWAITISYFTMRSIVGPTIESFYPTGIYYMGATSLVFGNFIYMYLYMIGCAKREQWHLVKYAFVTPFYWLGMSIASWKAVWEMIVNPHYWSKTIHGLHLIKHHPKRKLFEQTTVDHILSDHMRKPKILPQQDLPPYCRILYQNPAVQTAT